MLRGHTDGVYTVSFASDGRRMLSASDDGTARIWDLLGTGSQVLRGHEDDVYRARFSPDGAWVATASLDGSARLWDVQSAGVRVLAPDTGPIMAVRAVDGAVVTAGPGFASRWDLATGKRVSIASVAPTGPRNSYWKASTPLLSKDGTVVASIGDEDNVLLVTGGQQRALRGHTAWVSVGALSKDGKTLYTGARDGSVRAWDVASGTGSVVFQGKGKIEALALAEDGRLAVFADDKLHQIMPDGSPSVLGEGSPWCARNLMFDPQGRLMIFRCNHSTGLLTSAGMIDLHVDNYMPVRVAVSPDGKRIAAAMTDRTVLIWDASTGRQITVLRGHADLVLGVAWSPDGTRVASASYDHTVRIWDLERGTARVLRGHGSAVQAVEWIEDGAKLVSGSTDGTVRIWTAPPREPPSPTQVRADLARVTTARVGEDDRPATRVN